MEIAEPGAPTATTDPPPRTASLARAVIVGAGSMTLGGCAVLAVEFLLNRGQSRPSDLSWPSILVGYPILGAVVGWMSHRNPETRTGARGLVPPEGYYATGPVSAEASEARLRRLRTSVWTGFGGGVIAALAASAVDFAARGWPFVGGTLSGGLVLLPLLGAGFGLGLGQRRGDPKPSPRDARFGMRTLMILTAYLALLLGFGMRISRVSTEASLLHVKSRMASKSARFYRDRLDEFYANVGRNPPRPSLDPQNVDIFRRLAEHQEQLAEKYAKAAQTPWLPVAPDPPPPN